MARPREHIHRGHGFQLVTELSEAENIPRESCGVAGDVHHALRLHRGNGGDGALDYNGSGTISGGIVVACGMGGMSQNLSDGNQCSAMINLSGSGEIKLTDASGNVLLSYTPADDYSCIVVSCPKLAEGSEYTLSYGSASQSFTQSEAHMDSASNAPGIFGVMGGFGGDVNGNMGGSFDKSRRP